MTQGQGVVRGRDAVAPLPDPIEGASWQGDTLARDASETREGASWQGDMVTRNVASGHEGTRGHGDKGRGKKKLGRDAVAPLPIV